LVAVLSDKGEIKESTKFPTPDDYETWKNTLRTTLKDFQASDFRAGAIAAPGRIDRNHHSIVKLGNLDWHNTPLESDVEKITGCPMKLENDAKLAGLSEALLIQNNYSRVLYLTISTGIGIGVISDGKIDEHIGDGGGRALLVEHHGKLVPWESFASGKAIFDTYGKMASEIDDPVIWAKIARNLVPGFLELIAVLEPEAIIVGGGAGRYIEKFHEPLFEELKKFETPLMPLPPILGAKRPDEAVIYGCYAYAKQHYS
jgi:predicted NBD/HSP70 family sugar kinase